MINPYEVESQPEPDEHPHRACCFCPYAIDDEETVTIVSGDRVNGYQVAHVGCAAECPHCHQVVSEKTLVRINRTRAVCGDCARNIVDVALGRESERVADERVGK